MPGGIITVIYAPGRVAFFVIFRIFKSQSKEQCPQL